MKNGMKEREITNSGPQLNLIVKSVQHIGK